MTDLTGWVLASRLATEATRAVLYRTRSGRGDDYMTPEQADALWAALIAASPSPPVDVAGLVASLERATREVLQYREVAGRMEAAEAECARLREALAAVASLIDESDGVAGLHRNGDIATWGELRTGGRFEEWLAPFDAALTHQDPTK